MDILQLQEMANGMPTPALLEAVNNPNSPVPSFLALTVLSERKKAALAGNAQKAQAEMAGQPPTVAQQVSQEAHGVAGLPTGNAIPQQYAAGGVVAFADGGWTPPDFSRLSDPSTFAAGPTLIDLWRSFHAGLKRRDPRTGLEAPAQVAPPPNEINAPSSPIPWGGELNRRGPPGVPSLATPGIAPPGTNRASAGVASIGGGGSGFKEPTFNDPRIGAAPRVTEEQRTQMYKQKYEEIKALFGPDAAEQYLKEIQGEREALKTRYEDNKNEAWLRAGLGMLAGRSKYGAVNIGEGGQQGLNAYQAGRASLDNQGRDLRREQMQAAMQMQARQDQMRGLGIQQGEAAAGRQDQVRAEDIAVGAAKNEWAKDIAKLGIENRKVEAMMAEVGARYAQIKASKEQHTDEKQWRIIDGAYAGAVKEVTERYKDNPLAMQKMTPAQFADEVDRAFQMRVTRTREELGRIGGGGARRATAAGLGLD
jgi:hypothetical protein